MLRVVIVSPTAAVLRPMCSLPRMASILSRVVSIVMRSRVIFSVVSFPVPRGGRRSRKSKAENDGGGREECLHELLDETAGLRAKFKVDLRHPLQTERRAASA